MNKAWIILLGALMGVGLLILVVHRPVTVVVDGQVTAAVDTPALTAGWALRDAGIALAEGDLVTPGLSQSLPWNEAVVEISRARPAHLWVDGAGLVKSWRTVRRLPAELLAEAGIGLAADQALLWNGGPVALDRALPPAVEYLLQVRRPLSATLAANGSEQALTSLGPTVGRALWDAGLRLTLADFSSSPFNAPLADKMTLTVTAARVVRIGVDGKVVEGRSAGQTVGEALADAGVSLQGLDFAVPDDDQPLPASGEVRVVRVRETVELQEQSIPYQSEQAADPTLELDQTRIIVAGRAGVRVTRVRVRSEDGTEVSREKEAEWLAAQPVNQKIGYGTKIVIRTLDTPDGPIQYYRKVTVYATSYAPCNFIPFIGRCSYTTAAGYTLQKGVIGVGEVWYNLMKGWNVYVDGYGAARVGDYGYVPGFWVDLGYSDADFINWHRNTTLYFLAPPPANVPWILPK